MRLNFLTLVLLQALNYDLRLSLGSWKFTAGPLVER